MNIRLKFFTSLFLLSASVQAQQIKVSYSSTAFDGVFTGKVLLYLSKDSNTPKDLGVGVPTLCCFAIDVNQIKPNKSGRTDFTLRQTNREINYFHLTKKCQLMISYFMLS